MGRRAALAVVLWFAAAAGAQTPLEATTATGEKVKLFADGRWEYVDPAKAEPQKKVREAADERERAAQGGWFGLGRKVYEGDKDYNRGSLNPNRR